MILVESNSWPRLSDPPDKLLLLKMPNKFKKSHTVHYNGVA